MLRLGKISFQKIRAKVQSYYKLFCIHYSGVLVYQSCCHGTRVAQSLVIPQEHAHGDQMVNYG